MDPNTPLLSAILAIVSWSLFTQHKDGRKLSKIETTVTFLKEEVNLLRRWRHSFGNRRLSRELEVELNNLHHGEKENG